MTAFAPPAIRARFFALGSTLLAGVSTLALIGSPSAHADNEAPAWSATTVSATSGFTPTRAILGPNADVQGRYVLCERDTGRVYLLSAPIAAQGGGTPSASDLAFTLPSPLNGAGHDCAVDASGSVYVATYSFASSSGTLTRYTPAGDGSYDPTPVASFDQGFVFGLAAAADGTVYAVRNGAIVRYTRDGDSYTSAPVEDPQQVIPSGALYGSGADLATDAAGDLFVKFVDQERDVPTTVVKIPIGGEPEVLYTDPVTQDDGSQVAYPSMTVDSVGNVFLLRQEYRKGVEPAGTLVRLARVGSGYASSPAVIGTSPSINANVHTWSYLAAAGRNRLLITTPSDLVSVAGPGLPPVPQSVAASAGDSSAVVSWTAPDIDGGLPVQGYAVARVTGSGSSAVSTQVCATDASTLSCSVGGLTNGSSYRFQVRAFTAEGYSKPVGVRVTPSVPVAFTTDLPATTYAAVKSTMTLSVEVAGDPAAVLQWQTSTDGGTTWTNMAGGKNVTSISRLVRQKNIGDLFRVRAIQRGSAPVFSTVTTLTTPKAPRQH